MRITEENSFVKVAQKIIQHVCKSYLELLQVELRLSWKLGELDKLLHNSHPDKGEKMQALADNLGIPDGKQVKKVHQLLSLECKFVGLQFLPSVEVIRLADQPSSFEPHLLQSNVDDVNCDDMIEQSNNEDALDENGLLDADLAAYSGKRFKLVVLNSKVKDEIDDDHDYDDGVSLDSEPFTNSNHKGSSGSATVPDMEGTLKCCFCWMSFEEPTFFKLHCDSHRGALRAKGGFVCEVEECQQKFTTHLDLNSHLKTHSEAVSLCQVCELGFINTNLLELHKLVHIKPVKVGNLPCRRVLCPESSCPAAVSGFGRISQLQNHFNIRHGVSIELYKCEECNLTFTISATRQIHRRKVHPGTKPDEKMSISRSEMRCEKQDCQQQFESHSERNAHLKTHSKAVKTCDICEFGFINENILRLHSLVHIKPVKVDGSKARKYVCPEAN